MRQFARLRGKLPTLQPAAAPVDDAVLRARLNNAMRRRMSDDLVNLIRRACMCGHAETAKGLWMVLRDLTLREEKQQYPNGRLPQKGILETLALEIAQAAQKDAEAD
ncbi:MAG TPA: hypothetical protein VMU81_14715 [Acetobacteraceae bacterium]|jgi:hypothetical protein|nr:hypothetical protein [Acetobacteraceae bacterium]